ncbi:MAG: glycosyltransferase family 2 protein [Patescibacteria group bacterium]
MGISAVILTHNNEDTLAATLESLKFCDEILVIDDHSKDLTSSVAEKTGVIVYPHGLDGNFATQRNFGLSKARGEWVLFVDSDEVVSNALAHEIQEAVQKVDSNGFYLKRQDVMWGKPLRHGETQNVRLLRLAKKGKGLWQRPVHEVWNITGVVGTLHNALQHTPHPDVAHFLDDINTYSTMNATHFFHEGIRVSGWQIVAYPVGKFIQNYILRQGFMDGMPGIVVALMMSFHSFLTRAKLWQLQQNHG